MYGVVKKTAFEKAKQQQGEYKDNDSDRSEIRNSRAMRAWQVKKDQSQYGVTV